MLLHKDHFTEISDKIFTLKCPHCNTVSSTTLISPPYYPTLARYRPASVGIAYLCNACHAPIFLRFNVFNYDLGNYRIVISDSPELVEFPSIDFEFEYLPDQIRDDLKEAFSCYSVGCNNAFAAMCRRTIQSVAKEMGAKGKDKVQKQIEELREGSNLDDETFEIIHQIIIGGHDGAHPHLPTVTQERSAILLELFKDILYQLYVRRGKIKKVNELRANESKK